MIVYGYRKDDLVYGNAVCDEVRDLTLKLVLFAPSGLVYSSKLEYCNSRIKELRSDTRALVVTVINSLRDLLPGDLLRAVCCVLLRVCDVGHCAKLLASQALYDGFEFAQ